MDFESVVVDSVQTDAVGGEQHFLPHVFVVVLQFVKCYSEISIATTVLS